MNILTTDLPGVKIVEPKVFGDARGFFVETWQQRRYAEAGLGGTMVQDNMSRSVGNVLRGLHYQYPQPQGKLVYVIEGEILDVAVDVRRGSPTFGQWVSVTLSAENKRQVFLPEGFAHGFYVVSPSALVAYKCTTPYEPKFDRGVRWDDPQLSIEWPTSTPILSAKDQALPLLRDISPDLLPRFETPEQALAPVQEVLAESPV
jgi:dTDP-4-dehydrorhamnose 3,5-epimerase